MSDAQSDPEQQTQQNPKDATNVAGPGALRGQVWLTVQTRQAQRLIRGRRATPEKPAIIGLVGFADRLRGIWQAARNDDPYADWWLVKVNDALERVRERIRAEQAALDAQFEQLGALEVTVAESMEPYRIALQFANPYAYRGAQLIAEYDTFVRTLFTAQHVSLLNAPATQSLLNANARKIRGTFALVQGYHSLGIDRAALIQSTANANRARKAMGEVPEDILNGTHQAPLLPRKVRFLEAAGSYIDLEPVESMPTTAIVPMLKDDVGSI